MLSRTGLPVFLTKPGDISNLKEKLETLINDKGLRRQLGENGRKKAEKEFALDVMLDRYEELINANLKNSL
jgi:glycosyltransferase involved in cell wall biosynthesis